MPNWCENDLYIQGKPEEVARVLAHVGADKTPAAFDFNAVIPYPAQFREQDDSAARFAWWKTTNVEQSQDPEVRAAAKAEHIAKYGSEKDGFNSGGYEWCSANWGTKWDAGRVERRDYQGVACVTFRTAWSAPRPVIVALAKMFPECTFRIEYFERGTAVAGGFQCPCAEDFYDEERYAWVAGVVVNDWQTKSYGGHRGG